MTTFQVGPKGGRYLNHVWVKAGAIVTLADPIVNSSGGKPCRTIRVHSWEDVGTYGSRLYSREDFPVGGLVWWINEEDLLPCGAFTWQRVEEEGQ